MNKKLHSVIVLPAILFFISHAAIAQQYDTSLYNSLRWRSIGPYRGGRTVAAAGVPQQPDIFYIGVNNGGVWKTTDYGRTWNPVFDNEPTGSIGAIAVAPSNPDIIYVGSGEGLHRPDLSVGDGMYKSTDAGKTWTHLGLTDAQQIPKIAIDPKNPDRIFVAVLGHPYGPSKERGIYKSEDGGKTFTNVLYIDENTGGDDVAIDPANPNTVYATLWQAQEGPWENSEWSGTKGGIFKSTDGGNTWKKINKNLPEDMVQAHIAIAPSSSNTIYVALGTTETNEYGTGEGMGLYRSDDGGESWHEVTDDGRPEARIGGGDVPEIMVDPKDAETLYSTSIVAWRSVDGGKKWKALRGAPGGDDYQNIWINPTDTKIILITADQGASVSVNGGETWSSWYNQPTAQLYHVSADNAFPYNVYSGQQESGSVGIASRGNDGEITFRDWHPVGAEEYGYVAPDPLNSNIIYGGKISKYNKLTGQTQNIAPEAIRSGKYRFVRTEPVVFSPVDHKTLYFAGNVLFKTTDGGNNWQIISPDLSREKWDIPASVGMYTNDAMKTMQRRGVIYSVTPSPVDINTIWAGTDDGLIHVTKDGGKTWKNVTPPEITSWSKISMIDAGHFDINTAYVAVNRFRCDDMSPYIYVTHDGGATWHKIVNDLPAEPVNAVKEDPKKKGLLFAASETQTYVSFNDGGNWQSLRLNMPATSVRDLIIKDNDLVVATHGRGFWILDDIASLRQIDHSSSQKNILFKPSNAIRVRWDMNTDTPLPPDEPAGQNPPEGAIIDYYLKDKANGEVILEISDSKGNLVRRYSSKDTLYTIPQVDIPLYWIRPQQILSAEAGSHRFIWDMHYTPQNVPASYPMAAIYKNTAPAYTSPWVMPGSYTIKLTVNGETFTQPLTIKMDPRVKMPVADLQKQHDLSLLCYQGQIKISEILRQIAQVKSKLSESMKDAKDSQLAELKNADAELNGFTASKPHSKSITFEQLDEQFGGLLGRLQESDNPPTKNVIDAVNETAKNFRELTARWMKVASKFSK